MSDEIFIFLEALCVIALVVGVSYFVNQKRGDSKMNKPSKIKSFTTNISLDKAMKIIIQFAQSNGYNVDDFNEIDSIIVLSDSAYFRYSFIFPVYLSKQSDNSIMIEVGAKSKFPMPEQSYNKEILTHERCFNGIKTAIYAAS